MTLEIKSGSDGRGLEVVKGIEVTVGYYDER